jgi:hypothetical protein
VRPFICAILAAVFPVMTSAQSIPPAIFTDPPADAAIPKICLGNLAVRSMGTSMRLSESAPRRRWCATFHLRSL